MDLRISAWAAIAAAVIAIPSGIIGLLAALMTDNVALNQAIIPLQLITSAIAIVISLGFLKIAEKKNLPFLKNMVLISIAMILLITTYTVTGLENIAMSIFLMIALGLVELLLGISIFRLKKDFGRPVTALGVFYIINGFFCMTIILFMFIPFTATVASVLEAVVLFRAAKKIK